MPAQVKLPTGDTIEFEITYTLTTVDDIKKKIEEEHPAYPVACQVLSFDEVVLVEGSKTLEEINYVKDRCLVLSLKQMITINRDGSPPITLEYRKLEEVNDFRRRVATALSITPERLKLTYLGATVEDQEGYTLEDKGVGPGSELHVAIPSEGSSNTSRQSA